MWSPLIVAALAGPIFTTVSEEHPLSEDGNWPRLFPAGGGDWHFLHATEGEYYYVLLDERFYPVDGTRRALTGSHVLRDHGLALCPDGTYLDAATAQLDRANDSLYVYRFDDSFNLLDGAPILERASSTVVLADVPAVCRESYTGVAWLMPWDSPSTRYAELNEALAVVGTHALYNAPQAMGSSLLAEDGELRVIGFPTLDPDPKLTFASYDAAFDEVAHWEADVVPEGWTPYWAQASVRVGDVYIIAHMAQDDAYRWDTQGGDLWLEALDLDWNLVDQLKITSNTPPIGGMQPGMARVDDELVLTYSKDLHNSAFVVGIDLVACGEEEDTGDSGEVDTAEDSDPAPEDSVGQEETGDKATPGCGCVLAPRVAPAWALLLCAWAGARRRG